MKSILYSAAKFIMLIKYILLSSGSISMQGLTCSKRIIIAYSLEEVLCKERAKASITYIKLKLMHETTHENLS